MASNPRLRASDDDRDRTATMLREHHAAGRIDADEFNERLDRAFAAKTIGELEDLLSDLPSIDLYRLPDQGLPRRPPVPGGGAHLAAMAAAGATSRHGRFSPVWQAAWGSWLSCSAVLIVIWALSGMGYPWFAWVVAPWGALMAVRWVAGGHPGGQQDPPR
ncbi:MAG: DUF1707 SHOCT-like domain-containing protein [Streptosporangiaceae bacterium]